MSYLRVIEIHMKAFLSVILASLILFFSTGFKIATHYCGDVAVSSSFSTSGIVEGCGMEAAQVNDCNSEMPLVSEKNCCNDKVIHLEIQDDYEPSEKASSLGFTFLSAFVQVFIVNHFSDQEEIEFKDYSPPLVQHDLLVEHQTFLI